MIINEHYPDGREKWHVDLRTGGYNIKCQQDIDEMVIALCVKIGKLEEKISKANELLTIFKGIFK